MGQRLRIAMQTVGFSMLALVGAALGVWRTGATVASLRSLTSLSPGVWLGVVVFTLGIFATDAWRYRAVARAVACEISWRAGLNASIACHFFSCITPGAALGAPAAVAMLVRDGVDAPTSTVVSFGKSMLGSTALFLGAFAVLAVGLGPTLPASIQVLLLWGLGVVSAILCSMVLLALFPNPVHRLSARWDRYWMGRRMQTVATAMSSGLRGTVGRLSQLHAAAVPELLLSQASHYLVMVGLMVLLALAWDAAPFEQVVGSAWVYLAFLYVAPTPGAAGLAEGTAGDFFGGVLPLGDALVVVLLYRALAFYLFVGIGALHLGLLNLLVIPDPDAR